MNAADVIGYAYEADLHCIACTVARFGHEPTEEDEDSEGNPIHPLFAGDEYQAEGEYCGDCHAEIREPQS